MQLGHHDVTFDRPGKRCGKNAPQFDTRTVLARWGGRGSDTHQQPIGGHGDDGSLRGRPGPDPLCQRQAFLFAAGMCAGPKISGVKVYSVRTLRSANRLRHALKIAARSLLHNDSVFDASYCGLCARTHRPPT
jgi:transposase